MELDWSEQSPHIRSLFHPWRPGDGYEEAEIVETEERLGLRLPTTLRNFYLAWGKRNNLTQVNNPLLSPAHLEMKADALVCWATNQGSVIWSMLREDLKEADPPVMAKEFWLERAGELSHSHLSGFLDDMTYNHAFIPGRAIHGGWTGPYDPHLPDHHIAWLEKHWSKATAGKLVFALETDQPPTLYVRDGQAFWTEEGTSCLAARDAETLDEIAQRFQLKWTTRW